MPKFHEVRCTPATGYRQARAMHRAFVNLIIPINRFSMEHPNWGPGEYEAHVVRLGDVVRRLSMRSGPERELFSGAIKRVQKLEKRSVFTAYTVYWWQTMFRVAFRLQKGKWQ